MDFKSTIDLIIRDLNEASEIIDDLKKYPGVPILQVELAKSKCKSAGEVIGLLKTLTEIVPVKDDRIVEKHDKKSEAAAPVKQVAETPIVADKFSQPASRYDEQAGKKKAEKDLSDQLKTKTVKSLSEAIGISDKFLFIGEIFDGNKESYMQAISRLDKVASLDEAVTIIKGYTGDKPESEAVVQLLDLVRLKLPSNE